MKVDHTISEKKEKSLFLCNPVAVDLSFSFLVVSSTPHCYTFRRVNDYILEICFAADVGGFTLKSAVEEGTADKESVTDTVNFLSETAPSLTSYRLTT